MQTYAWPASVRELENVLERAAIPAPGPVVDVELHPAESVPRLRRWRSAVTASSPCIPMTRSSCRVVPAPSTHRASPGGEADGSSGPVCRP